MKTIQGDLSSLDLELHEARESTSLEIDVFVQCYALVVVHANIGLDQMNILT